MKKVFSAMFICMLFTLKAFSFTQIINVQNDVFNPKTATVNLGDTVKWVWVNGTHTTTSLTIPAGATAWDNPINSTSKSFIYVPKVAGTYNYKCSIHFAMGMTGTFTVVCPQASAHISASSDTVFCKGGSVLLTSSVSSGIKSFQWKKNGTNIAGATSSTFTATVSGSYTLSVTNNCSNTATSNAIGVTVNPLPKATITPSDTVFICTGSSVKLVANSGASFAYQWTKNGTNIAGATSKTFTARNAGNYRVIVTQTTTGCSKQSAITKVIINCSPVVKNNLPASLIKIFPNPSSNDFHISLSSVSSKYSLSIFDANGNQIGNSKIVSNDISFGSDLKPGIYMVRIKNGNALVHEEKIIKE